MRVVAAFIITIVTLTQLVLFIHQAKAQIPDSIQKSGTYLLGTGQSEDYRKADIQSVEDLTVKLEKYLKEMLQATSKEAGLGDKPNSEMAVKTYLNALIHSSETKMETIDGNYRVIRYISKRIVNNVFQEREKKIRDLIKTASQAENGQRIGDALCYYYWSYAMVMTLPAFERVEIALQDGTNMLMEEYLQNKIVSVLSDVSITPGKVDFDPEKLYKSIEVKMLYKGKEVENVDYNYYSAQSGFSPMYQTANGIGLIELAGESSKLLTNVDLFIEYEYKNKAVDEDIRYILENMKIPGFKQSHFSINLPDFSSESEHPTASVSDEPVTANVGVVNISESSATDYKKIVTTVLNKLKKGDSTGIDKYFSETGWTMYKRLIRYGRVSLLSNTDTLKVIQVGDQVQVRTIPMGFNFQNNHKRFVENVVFTIDIQSKKIGELSFGLGDMAIAGIVGKSAAFASTEEKYQLIKFLESYKTAYALKNLDYISKIFADNALIIIGNLVQEDKPIDGMYENAGSQNVRYIRLNKKEFIERLSKAFNSNEFINIRFEESNVKRVNSDEKIFGIQIGQYYESSSYHDFGYLFLMIDLKDSMHPKIYVRTWQPRKNPDGSIFGLADFEI